MKICGQLLNLELGTLTLNWQLRCLICGQLLNLELGTLTLNRQLRCLICGQLLNLELGTLNLELAAPLPYLWDLCELLTANY